MKIEFKKMADSHKMLDSQEKLIHMLNVVNQFYYDLHEKKELYKKGYATNVKIDVNLSNTYVSVKNNIDYDVPPDFFLPLKLVKGIGDKGRIDLAFAGDIFSFHFEKVIVKDAKLKGELNDQYKHIQNLHTLKGHGWTVDYKNSTAVKLIDGSMHNGEGYSELYYRGFRNKVMIEYHLDLKKEEAVSYRWLAEQGRENQVVTDEDFSFMHKHALADTFVNKDVFLPEYESLHKFIFNGLELEFIKLTESYGNMICTFDGESIFFLKTKIPMICIAEQIETADTDLEQEFRNNLLHFYWIDRVIGNDLIAKLNTDGIEEVEKFLGDFAMVGEL